MPLKFEVDLLAGSDGANQIVRPCSATVSYTDFGGAVIKPIQEGEWELQGKALRMWLDFPESFGRGDVQIPAGRLYLQGELWTSEDLAIADQEYFQARSLAWRASEAVEEVERAKSAPKKWNSATSMWERQAPPDNAASLAVKQVEAARAEARRAELWRQRPEASELCAAEGSWPTIDGGMWLRRGGLISTAPRPMTQPRGSSSSRLPGSQSPLGGMVDAMSGLVASATWTAGSGVVLGYWAAEPVLEDAAVSYY